MGKLISQIQNYPLSEGAVAYENHLLLDNEFMLQQDQLNDYLKRWFEWSKDISFFDKTHLPTNTWNDLLKNEPAFILATFMHLDARAFIQFFSNLPQINHFNADGSLSEKEYEILCFQRLQIIAHLFSFYRLICTSMSGEINIRVNKLLKNEKTKNIFIRFNTLLLECLSDDEKLKAQNKQAAPDFNETVFTTLDENLLLQLNEFYNPIHTSGTKLLGIYSNAEDKFKAANEYLNSICNQLMQVHQSFSFWAASQLNELATTASDHTPHTALLLTFAKLKLSYDVRFNQLIKQNTDFIFSDILQVKRQPVKADTAYVCVTLAKNISTYLVEKGTRFKAGKNSEGKPLYYESAQDIVLNAASIEQVKSCVRLYQGNQLTAVLATDDATDTGWQVNQAWPPFNDIEESKSGIAFESKLLTSVSEKNTTVEIDFGFGANIPDVKSLADKFILHLKMSDGSREELNISSLSIPQGQTKKLVLKATLPKKLKVVVHKGVNTYLKMRSPEKDESASAFTKLFQFLLTHPLETIRVTLSNHVFAPAYIRTSYALLNANEGFIAFGTQSHAGASFTLHHPFIRYADKVDMDITWEEKLKEDITVSTEDKSTTLTKGHLVSSIEEISNQYETAITVSLTDDVQYTREATIKGKKRDKKIETRLPRVLQVKSIKLTASLTEEIYDRDGQHADENDDLPSSGKRPKITLPTHNKTKQREHIRKNYLEDKKKIILKIDPSNRINSLYPLGEVRKNKQNPITFLPDYTKYGFGNYDAELYIGLSGIAPGQSLSLLFDIANETAAQSELEASIEWHYLRNNTFVKLESTKMTDTTNNFIQTGIVQLSLPQDATDTNTILTGKSLYWIVARCKNNYEVTANIKNISTNALPVDRVFDETNHEAKVSVPPATIENVFPKTANIKTVAQPTPSLNGREKETDKHFFWRISQGLRHKQRSITQWDIEHLTLEHFTSVSKVRCLNHAFFDQATDTVHAKATHTLVVVMPSVKLNPDAVNFMPAIPMSELTAIKSFLQSKTGAFNQLHVVNTQWDIISFELKVMFNKGINDLPFYQKKLDEDIKKFVAPWAFDNTRQIPTASTIFIATIIDYIDELNYIHHIIDLKIYKNGIEQNDELKPTSEIHLFTSAPEHPLNVVPYADQ